MNLLRPAALAAALAVLGVTAPARLAGQLPPSPPVCTTGNGDPCEGWIETEVSFTVGSTGPSLSISVLNTVITFGTMTQVDTVYGNVLSYITHSGNVQYSLYVTADYEFFDALNPANDDYMPSDAMYMGPPASCAPRVGTQQPNVFPFTEPYALVTAIPAGSYGPAAGPTYSCSGTDYSFHIRYGFAPTQMYPPDTYTLSFVFALVAD